MNSSFEIYCSLFRQAKAGKEIIVPDMSFKMKKAVLSRIKKEEERSYRIHHLGMSSDEVFRREENTTVAMRMALM